MVPGVPPSSQHASSSSCPTSEHGRIQSPAGAGAASAPASASPRSRAAMFAPGVANYLQHLSCNRAVPGLRACGAAGAGACADAAGWGFRSRRKDVGPGEIFAERSKPGGSVRAACREGLPVVGRVPLLSRALVALRLVACAGADAADGWIAA